MTYIADRTVSLSHRSSWLASLVRAAQVAKQRRALKSLDDSALADIGISRHAAEVESQRPFWDAPETWRC